MEGPNISSWNCTHETHVLLVDHNEQLLISTARILNYFSYQVTTVASGFEAISMLIDASKNFDIVLAEANLPDINGFMLLKETTSKNIPMILMSADEQNEVAARMAIEAGACYYMGKPANVQVLNILWQFVKKNKSAKTSKSKDNAMFINSAETISQEKLIRNVTNFQEKKYDTKKRGRTTDVNEDVFTIKSDKKKKMKSYHTTWNDDLHAKFVNVVRQLGDGKCYPKDILEKMNVPGLTRMQVASHLQKCRQGNWRGPIETRNQNTQGSVANNVGPRKYGAMPLLAIPPVAPITPPTPSVLQQLANDAPIENYQPFNLSDLDFGALWDLLGNENTDTIPMDHDVRAHTSTLDVFSDNNVKNTSNNSLFFNNDFVKNLPNMGESVDFPQSQFDGPTPFMGYNPIQEAFPFGLGSLFFDQNPNGFGM